MKNPSKAYVKREVRRIQNGLAGYLYWAASFCFIEDKVTHRPVLLNCWPAQLEVIKDIFLGLWLWILKARRVGFTWLVASYAVWLVNFHAHRTVVVLNQDDAYAKDFLDKCRYIIDRMPPWMRRTLTRDSQGRLEFNHNGHGSWIRAFAPTKRALHSLAADLVIIDEGARVPWLKEILQAAEPTLETSGGQLISLTTSDGPLGTWADVFKRSRRKETKFKALFFGWEAKPGRDKAWYESEAKSHAHDPLYMKRQYPRTPDEAFEAAEGRVYPLFNDSAQFVRSIPIHADWPKFRAVDFGGVHPFVCLWLTEIPGDPPGFTIAPECRNTINEFLMYSLGDDGEPADEFNHAMDAVRYAVTSHGQYGLRGHVHVYRELYQADTARLGLALPDLARRIIQLTGNERIKGTVADRSRPDNIAWMCQMGVPTFGQRSMKGGLKGDIGQGCDQVRALIASTALNRSLVPPTPKAPVKGRSLEGARSALSFKGIPGQRVHRPRPVFA